MPLRRQTNRRHCFSALQRAENSSIYDAEQHSVELGACFSALQRAENSSISSALPTVICSVSSFSALQRAENSSIVEELALGLANVGFSALQRAENSSILTFDVQFVLHTTFQCSSASRKFLNRSRSRAGGAGTAFQCSSASRKFLNCAGRATDCVTIRVSVLFSEPKIPQLGSTSRVNMPNTRSFSALQRAENSSIDWRLRKRTCSLSFSALQRAENSSIARRRRRTLKTHSVSVLFSEPKIPQ